LVPSEAPWPEEAWGMKLGHRVNNTCNQEHYVKDHPERRVSWIRKATRGVRMSWVR
jgi:hypothetical protein